MFDEGLEAIEAGVPEFLPLPQPPLRFFERSGFQRADLLAAVAATLDQPRALQHLHMLGSAGERHSERFTQLADRFLAERQVGKHSPPGRIGQRMESRVESIFNHMV
jgi:hypothetical protein